MKEIKDYTLYWLARRLNFCLYTSLSLMAVISFCSNSKSSSSSGESSWPTNISSSIVLKLRVDKLKKKLKITGNAKGIAGAF
jgi:hypothetical protein